MNKETLQLEIAEMNAVRGMFSSDEFRKFVTEPLEQEKAILRSAYDCKDMLELATIKGKKEGLDFLLDIIDGIGTRISNKEFELDNLDAS